MSSNARRPIAGSAESGYQLAFLPLHISNARFS
jgi:hypothetical protein